MTTTEASAAPRLRLVTDRPTPKQVEFLSVDSTEALFQAGGAAGKSWALLAAALQYVDVPGYRAIILRRYLTDLTRADGLIDRVASLIERFGHGEVDYDRHQRSFVFRSGAKLYFQHAENATEPLSTRLMARRYQFIGIDMADELPAAPDDLTAFPRPPWLYTALLGRLDRPHGMTGPDMRYWHGAATDGTHLGVVPLRMRLTSRPGPRDRRDVGTVSEHPGVTAAMCAPCSPLSSGWTPPAALTDLFFPEVPAVSRRPVTFDVEPFLGPPRPEVVLELPGMIVRRYEDGSHMIEQAPATPTWDRFAREFGEIRHAGIDRVFPYRPRRRDDCDGYEDDD